MEDLKYKIKSIWDKADGKQQKNMHEYAKKYIKFISENKTERECVQAVRTRLQEAGFNEDFKKGKYFALLHNKSLFAVCKGKKDLSEGFRLVTAHCDSPRLDFKQNPLLESVGIAQAKTHYYGGILKYQWLARPLALHGVAVKKNGEAVNIVIGEKTSDPVFTISDLLPHLAKEHVTQTVTKAFEAEKLNLVIGHIPFPQKGKEKPENPIKLQVLKLLNKKYGIIEEDLLSAEIQAVPAGDARFVGLDQGLVGGYGQDDRICVFTALEAFLEVENPEYTTALMLWDKEEIGSEGTTGASSRFFEYCMQDTVAAWASKSTMRQVMLAGKALSADVHAAIDPDWQELHEKQNSAIIGYGPTICKFTGSGGKYGANDAHPEYIAWLRNIFAEKEIPWQLAALGKVDHGGGGTVALFLAVYGMNVIDMGPALLGMHSPFELSSAADIYYTKEAYKAFYSA